ncbi:MAG: phosphotransferase family protein [Ktedonobacteraceae bacterium]
MDIPAAYLDRIHAILPTLVITSMHFNQDGMINDVVMVNDQLIARFPKDGHAKESLARESRILELVGARVEMPVPHFEYQAQDVVIYRMLAGEPLTREMLLRQDEARQDRLAEQLALFLSQLHAIPRELVEQHEVGMSEAERSLEDWSTMFADIQGELFPFLWAHQKSWVRQLFAPVLDGQISLRYQPVLIHGDLGVYHILYDPIRGGINGIIDFGTSGLGDPASDFACLIQALGEGFLQRMARFSAAITSALDRARFRAGALELEWALHGIRTDDASWWLAHIGGARDVMPLGESWRTPQ